VLRQSAEWRRTGIDLEIAVNLSTRPLADAALSGWKLPRRPWSRTSNKPLNYSTGCDALGIRVAIDDFGAGWARCSLGQGFLYGRPTPGAAVPIQRANRL
jgi:EAL domain-containing protein (putative c-di-GMP-specific phosphodiesterase class I)